MSDALLSPTVGFAFCAVSAALLGYSARKIRAESDESKIPLMGVLSAFVFAAQMINFSIPGTGSSGHLSGGLLLAVFLGPYRGFLAIASVLVIQCLFFADGGLMALGANIFNMGFWACFIVYPLLWRPWLEAGFSRPRLAFISILSAMIILLLGALGVVLETSFSGIADLPLSTFMMFMLPIHLGIALVEGAATLAIILFIRRTRPELLGILAEEGAGPSRLAYAKGAAVLLTMALFTGAVLSRFASTRPDGLEWSLAKTRAAKAAGKPVFSASPAATMPRIQRGRNPGRRTAYRVPEHPGCPELRDYTGLWARRWHWRSRSDWDSRFGTGAVNPRGRGLR
ncbi:MAG: energy-coupling factor ABC transporter permease [Fibrobacteria bacterium]